MSGQVTESIFSGETMVIPMADVQCYRKLKDAHTGTIEIITKHTKWNTECNNYNNSIYLYGDEATAFKIAWCHYRSELEADTLKDIRPDA